MQSTTPSTTQQWAGIRMQALVAIIFFAGASYMIGYLLFYSVFPADDAYIHMRIAKHMALYGQPYFNLDQQVASSSSPLWLLLLSTLFMLGGANPLLLPPLSIVITLALFAVLSMVFSRYAHPAGATAGAALAMILGPLATAALQMETPLALLLWALSLLLLDRKRFPAAGVCAALAACTRYEMGLWLILAGLAVPGLHERIRFGFGAAPVMAALAGFNLYYFGSLLPNTIRAKSIIYELQFSESVAGTGFLFGPWLFVGLLAIGFGLAIGLIRDHTRRFTGVGLLFGILLLALYTGRNTFLFPWYIPLFYLPIMAGIFGVLAASARRQQLIALLVAILLLWHPNSLMLNEATGVLTGNRMGFREAGAGLRVHRYLEIGAVLYRDYPHASLMTSEVGGLGWAFEGRILDAVGLISPEFLRYHPLPIPEARIGGSTGAIPVAAVVESAPDLLVSIEVFSEAVRRAMANGQLDDYTLLQREPVLSDRIVPNVTHYRLWNSRYTEVYIHERLRNGHSTP